MKRISESEHRHRLNRLSVLQKWILRNAYRKSLGIGVNTKLLTKKNINPDYWHLDRFYTSEIKAGFYGLPMRVEFGIWKNISTKICAYPLGYVFEPHPKYQSACVAISRAISRLEKRGLVTALQAASSHWTAIQLTEIGKVVGKEEAEGI